MYTVTNITWNLNGNEITGTGRINGRPYTYRVEYCDGKQFTEDFRFMPDGFFKAMCNGTKIAYVSAKDEPRKAMDECEKHFASLAKRANSPITFTKNCCDAYIGPVEFTLNPEATDSDFNKAYWEAHSALVKRANEILAPHGIKIEKGENDYLGYFDVSGDDPSLFTSSDYYDHDDNELEDVFIKKIR